MIYSNPCEYAIRALSELVLMSGEAVPGNRRANMVMLDKITDEANLPRDFLAKIFRQLVQAGILVSSKGPGGGFALAKPAHDTSLIEVVEAIDGKEHIDGCVVGLARCNDHEPCPQHDLFKPIRQRLKSYLSSTTLADTATSLKEKKALHGRAGHR